MRVVLLSTYDLGRQPFGLASPAAWLKRAGFDVTCVDLSRDKLNPDTLAQVRLVAFYLPMHTATRMAAPLIEQTRERNPGARLIAYGLYAPLNEGYLRELGVSAIIGGEFEAALVEAVEGGTRAELVSLDRLAFQVPDRTTLPALDRYAALCIDGEKRVVGYTEASRGCKHLCRHCPVVPVYNGAFRVVPAGIVLEDIARQAAMGARHITFGDPDFFNGPTHAVRLMEAFHERFPALTYDATIKVEHLLKHRDLLPSLVRTGCLFVTTAVESTEDIVLERLDKGHTRAGFLEALSLARDAGLHLSPTFVPFTPWTTLEGFRDLLGVLLERELVDIVAPVQMALRLLIPSGSRVLELPEVAPLLTGFDQAGLLHRWRHPEPAVDQLAADIFTLVAAEQKLDTPRRVIFSNIWALAHDGAPPENFDLLPRATVPYLDEPWYC